MRKSYFFNLQISGYVYLKVAIISFFNLYKIHIFPKFGGCGSKNKPSTPFWILNFKWAWQAQFLSHNLLILQNCILLDDKQMILVPFIEIHKRMKVIIFGHSCHIHFWVIPDWSNGAEMLQSLLSLGFIDQIVLIHIFRQSFL